MNFESLVGHINQVQDVLQAQAAHAVNLSLTSRNWLVGYYIVEYEQHGEDRAKYGDWQSATAKLQTPENQSNEIWQSAITKLEEWSTPAHRLVVVYRLRRDHRTIRHRGSLAKSLRQQIPPPAAV